MPNAQQQPPPCTTVADFIEWPGDGTGRHLAGEAS
jgi:hypothetical protein